MAPKEDDTIELDGARVAAEILKFLPKAHQERLVAAIQERSPEAAAKIEDSFFQLRDITKLPSRIVETLVREVEHRDLVLSMRLAEPEVNDVLERHMSTRKKTMVRGDLTALGEVSEHELLRAKRRVLRKVSQLSFHQTESRKAGRSFLA